MENTEWLRPKTTRRYLHPPKAELLYTLWPEGKIVISEVSWDNYVRLDCSGLWLVHGADDAQLDFRGVQNRLPDSGIPFHGLTWRLGGLQVELDAFCEIARRPACFAALRFTNTGAAVVDEPFALLLRTGRERELVFRSPDVYASYAPDVQVWKDALSTWRCTAQGSRTLLHDDHAFLSCEGTVSAWDAEKGALRFPVRLAPGETLELTLSVGKSEMEPAGGKALPFCLAQEKAQAQAFWERELSRLNRLPQAVRADPERFRMVRNLTVQLLQCFCYPAGRDYLMARQGGLQRRIWPWEAMFGLEALSRIGDFAEYIEPVISMYFEQLQAPDGEIRPAGIGWGCISGSVLYTLARYAKNANIRCYHRWRDAAMAAFDWIKRTRASTAAMEGCIPGLFPPMRGSDAVQVFQSWTNTDVINIQCLNAFAETAALAGDPRADEIREEAESYLAAVRGVMQRFVREAEGTDELRIPLRPDGDDAELLRACHFNFNHGFFTDIGAVDDADVIRVYNYLVSHGIYRNDLYGHMPYRDGNMHIWYTNIPDFYWFRTWMRLGERERAEAIFAGQMRFSMTDEYYMIERYADNDPYYTPWSPNFSANGRMISMLLDLCADRS